MRFRIATIAYVFALLAAAMAAFGGPGIIVAAMVAFLHYGSWPKSWAERIVLVGVFLMVIALLLPAVEAAREAARHSSYIGHVTQLRVALQNYALVNGTLPSVCSRDATGAPLHSWRTALLPFIEHQSLLSTIQLDEPWNSPGNAQAASTHVGYYQCPSHAAAATAPSYFAVIGENTAWPTYGSRKPADITDPHEVTLLLIEAAHKPSSWAAPTDFTFD